MRLKRVVSGVIVAAALIGSVAMAIEEPAFKSVMHDGAFEVRDYPALVVAEVTVSGDQTQAGRQGFRLLAAYIFGGNKRRQTIAMTAPVAQVPTNQTIAMTAPVTQTQHAGQWVVRFTMPRGFTLDTLPQPNDPVVHLRQTPPARFAVLQFSGLAWPGDVRAKMADLRNLVAKHHLRPIGPVSLAQYNPPWTLWFLRRNEVMMPVSS